jgi:hypothetical protein
MTASLIVLVPLALLAIVLLLCFIGCGLSTTGTKQVTDYTDYDGTVTGTANLVAFWPLNEASGPTAADATNNHFDGTYTPGANVPYDPVQQSAAATGEVTPGNPGSGLVPGDVINNDPSQRDTSTYFNGGYVVVPWQSALNQPPFTIEAWVRAHWTAQDVQNSPAFRVVVGSDAPPTFQGFALYATPDNYWAAVVGVGSQNIVATQPPMSNQTIVLESNYYLVVTYDGTTLKLWVNPADTAAGPYAQAAATGFVPLASPIPLYIGTGHPDLPKPLLPFNGWIQDVAFYNAVLDDLTIEGHYSDGQGLRDP